MPNYILYFSNCIRRTIDSIFVKNKISLQKCCLVLPINLVKLLLIKLGKFLPVLDVNKYLKFYKCIIKTLRKINNFFRFLHLNTNIL